MIKHALRAVLIISASSLLFACGAQNAPDKTSVATGAAMVSRSVSAPPCSDTATVSAGMYDTLALKSDKTVTGVGQFNYGQLKVDSWTSIKAISAGWYHTVGVKEDGTVVAAGGKTNEGQVGDVYKLTGIKAVAAGGSHTVGLKEDGTVVAVGRYQEGQTSIPASWMNIKAIAAGAYHTVGLKEDGTVVAVGQNIYGQASIPASWTNIKAIAAGAYHTVGLKEDGTVVTVGLNASNGPLDVSSWTGIKAIAAGAYHTIGLKEDGTVVVAGANTSQMNVSSWTGIKAIAGGGYHTIGLKADGTVVVVGQNNYGQATIPASWTNIMPICGACDVTAPVSMATVTGTLGKNGWYVSDVQISFTATDEEGGSGVKEIHYAIDEKEMTVQGGSASMSLTTDGTHLVTYSAVDNAGNTSSAYKLNINIDKTPPSIPLLSGDPSILWPPNRKMINVLIEGRATDAGSGIASTTVAVTDEYGIYNLTPSGFGAVVALESWRAGSDFDGRIYTITAVATDKAGNQSTGTTTVVVPHDR